ncbi:MAG: phage holin [Clostridia bacterium]|nr:phage holin [Clostridia bacterium]
MNWKLRLQNKTTLITLIAAAVSLIYQVLAMFNIVPAITEEAILSVAGVAVNILCLLGIVVDPTTKGIADSERAMGYDLPSAGEVDEE